ncbi:MAG: sodium:proton antiporter [Dehalococcoidia bacterium]|nr:sodium:proton antiporter [Dehalococcoidia bacterium]
MLLVQAKGIESYFGALGLPAVVLWSAPFVLLLLSLAIVPLVAPNFWRPNRNKAIVAALFGLPVAVLIALLNVDTLANTILDYAAFIALLGALFTISGGIHLSGSFKPGPKVNTTFLLVGALLANFIGTTGASALLIRPLIATNRSRTRKAHIVIFFIFIVSNCAGLLTPIGDSPLFLGFLQGVPFIWTFRLWPQWLLAVGALLVAFYIVDSWFARKDRPTVPVIATAPPPYDPTRVIPSRLVEAPVSSSRRLLRPLLHIDGAHNFLFLALTVGLIIFCGYVVYPIRSSELLGEPMGVVLSKLVQLLGMAAIAFTAYRVTRSETREQNHFTFGPIVEVAVLFAGIFAAMIPVLLILETKGASLGVSHPWQFFWLAGGLSSFLDNAPTYLAFTSLAKGVLHMAGDQGLAGLALDPTGARYLAAIATGAVFMGANTYIGNGPNFMVKAIAEESGIKMPGFFGYMLWSLCILIPLFFVVTAIFFLA